MRVIIFVTIFGLGALIGLTLISLLSIASKSEEAMEKFYLQNNREDFKPHELYIFDCEHPESELLRDKITDSLMEKKVNPNIYYR